jgi:hypothetical protein
MNIEKRSFPLFVFLNCITLGVYGAIVSKKIGDEVNSICKGDNEEPTLNYIGVILIRAIPAFIGLVTGLVVGIASSSLLNSFISKFGYSFFVRAIRSTINSANTATVFLSIILFTALFSLLGNFVSSIYHKYWWFKQTSRLKLNANRYNIEVRESGADHFVFRTATNAVLLPATFLLKLLSLLIPTLLCLLIAKGSYVFAIVLFSIFVLIFCFFNAEMSVGASFSMYYVIKTLNRYSVACRNGGRAFDPMAYEYYPSVDSTYPSFVPQIMNGSFETKQENKAIDDIDDNFETVEKVKCGILTGLKGACAGYNFDLSPGEEIIIGKDAKVASVIIDPAYKEISRKHVSVIYDAEINRYRVTDYSSNGTWVDGKKLPTGETVNLRSGSILRLANDKNTFRLG